MEDEFLAEYLNSPALQAKYGNYRNYRDFMVKQSSNDTGILSNINFPQFNLPSFSNIKNLGGKVAGGIASAAMNIPGLGFMIDAFTRPQYPSDTMSKSFAVEKYGDPYGYYNDLVSGNLTGKDPFGINTLSFSGNYPAYYDQYVRDYEAGKYSPTSQFAIDKYAHGLDVTRKNRARIARDFANTDAEDDIGAGNYIAPVKTISTSSSTPSGGGGGGDGTYGVGSDGQKSYDSGQGFGISATTGGPVSNRTGRGRTGYKKGGLASIL